MPDQPTSDPNGQEFIARHLETNRERIISDWLKVVQADDQIPSADALTMTALKDHFPDMMTELVSSVRQGGVAGNDDEARETGRDHGRARWRNGYRLDELLRELARVREIVIAEVAVIRDVSEGARRKAMNSIRLLFDSIVAASALQFVSAQEAELILRSNQLQHAYELVQGVTDRLHSVEQSRLSLLRAVNHELRNALQPVTVTADLLVREDAANRKEIVEQLFRVAHRLQTFLDRLRELSDLLAGEVRAAPETFSLAELLKDLVKLYEPAAQQKKLRFEARLSVKTPEVRLDREKLYTIACELLSNAIKFTTEGFVRIEMLDGVSDRWLMRVTDSGIGIEPSDVNHLFQELHGEGKSMETAPRLGLVITRHLAHLLDGEVTFQATVGEGSVFEVDLPIVLMGRS